MSGSLPQSFSGRAWHGLGRLGRVGLGLGGLGVALTVVVVIRMTVGPAPVPPSALGDLLTGTALPDQHQFVLLQLRLPAALTALLAGAALGIAGLHMQTTFANPLADPFVLGVSAGATLGVALLLLGGRWWRAGDGSDTSFTGSTGTAVAATIGAAVVMTVMIGVGALVRSATTLLLLGVMLGGLVTAAVMVLLATARPELVAEFVQWGFGSFRGAALPQVGLLATVVGFCAAVSFAVSGRLNVLALGSRQASALGLSVPITRATVIALTAGLAGVTTAYCGPVQFLGIAVPHIARNVFRSADHRVLVPATALVGACLAVGVDTVATLPGGEVLPLNAVTALIGAPVVAWVLLRRSRALG